MIHRHNTVILYIIGLCLACIPLPLLGLHIMTHPYMRAIYPPLLFSLCSAWLEETSRPVELT